MTPRPPAASLEHEVDLLARRETRPRFDALLHLGRLDDPDRAQPGFVVRRQDLPLLDHGLRAEVVGALLLDVGATSASVWLVRPGAASPHDEDFAWFAATRLAFASAGAVLEGFYVVTPEGWRDVAA